MKEGKRVVVTHANPDFDAIAYLWLLKRFVPKFEDAEIKLLSFSQIDRDVLEKADSVGDMGSIYHPATWRFDHHHLPGTESTNTCAAKMTWEYLLFLQIDISWLADLIEIIHQGDLARTNPVGIHSILWGTGLQKNPITGQRLTDQEVISVGFELLDRVAAWLKHKSELAVELNDKVVWRSDDGLIWAIRHGSASLNFAAYEEGARVVVFEGEPFDNSGLLSYPVGASRAPEWQEPDLGKLVEEISTNPDVPHPIVNEVRMWYNHNAGFFSGRGSRKAPCALSVNCDLVELAKWIDRMWVR